MVRVGGGWTTLSHFLARHGGDPNQQILPDELLPLDTKSSQMNGPNGGMNSQSRTANANRHHHNNRIHNSGSTTHTL
ncbi:GAS2-like protein, partial [Euroglyphus maynei]